MDRHAKFATEHLSVAAARIESHPVGTGGNDGGNVVQFPTFFLREETKKGLAAWLDPCEYWLLDLGSNQGPTD